MQQNSWEKYQTIHDWVGKVIHWELCKRQEFNQTNKGYVHKREFVVENKTHKFSGILR